MTRKLVFIGGIIVLSIATLFWLYPLSEPAPIASPKIVQPSIQSSLANWKNGDNTLAISQLTQLSESDPEAEFYRFYLSGDARTKPDVSAEISVQSNQSCAQNLLFVAGDVVSLKQANTFKQRFNADKRLQNLDICIQSTIWFSPETLDCPAFGVNTSRITCDLQALAQGLKQKDFTHLVLFAEQGKAYVHNGIMYLDQQDTYDVFVHELAHFVGFVDEYSLSPELAKRVCEEQNLPNIAFHKSDVEKVDVSYWQSVQIEHPKLLAQAKTCDNHPIQAYKLSNKMTFMEYHDLAYIPESYLSIWEKRLLNPEWSPSAHVNFYQYFDDLGNRIESAFWRNKYQIYLDN